MKSILIFVFVLLVTVANQCLAETTTISHTFRTNSEFKRVLLISVDESGRVAEHAADYEKSPDGIKVFAGIAPTGRSLFALGIELADGRLISSPLHDPTAGELSESVQAAKQSVKELRRQIKAYRQQNSELETQLAGHKQDLMLKTGQNKVEEVLAQKIEIERKIAELQQQNP